MNCYENIPKASEGNPGFRDHAWTEDNQGAGILSRGTLGPLHRDAGKIAGCLFLMLVKTKIVAKQCAPYFESNH